MAVRMHRFPAALADRSLRTLSGAEGLVLVPALSLGAYAAGGVWLLAIVALALPLCLATLRIAKAGPGDRHGRTDPETGLPMRNAIVEALEANLAAGSDRIRRTSAFAIGIDELAELEHRLGPTGVDRVVTELASRLRWAVRGSDTVGRLGPGEFGLALATRARADIEILLKIGARLQAAAARPIVLDGTHVYISISLGFCPARRAPGLDGDSILGAAEQALARARAKGSATMRAFSPEIAAHAATATALTSRVREALETGEIEPWFQPQISVATGEVTGVEALARWSHSDLGLLPPAEFLPVVECAGLGERLTGHMLSRSLAALSSWERDGLRVPSVSINFTADDLRNPHLAEHLKWELDRHGLSPERLTVEVLETVIASTMNDTIIRNLWSVAELGCGIDLDDFGTGHASIGNIRRFSIQRVKIDRSFVSQLEKDPDQKNVVGAIVLMAERLGLDTLAEGVESAAELAVLARLGCGHAQGYGIARPMTGAATREWLRARAERPAPGNVPAPPAQEMPSGPAVETVGKTA